MSARRLLLFSTLSGGLLAAALAVLLVRANLARPVPSALAFAALFGAMSYLTWYRWLASRLAARSEVLARLSQGDLSVPPSLETEDASELRRLVLSLRRALSEVQRVSANVQRSSSHVLEEARSLLEAARRQAGAVDRTLGAVGSMGGSLEAAGQRVGQLETFSEETTAALMELSGRIDQVAAVLGTLNSFATRTGERVRAMTQRLLGIAESGEELLRFARDAENFVATVEGGIDSVRRRAQETGALAQEVTSTARAGQELVANSVKGLVEIEETVRRAADIVDSLGTRSLEIGRVVDVIQEVADQTHLLALNAAIIASQAGEHGNAFGVVADEIRSLAERTARSTREIAALVFGVRGAVHTAVDLVREARARTRDGVVLGARASDALQVIGNTTERTFAAIEATVSEVARLEAQGRHVGDASRKVAHQVSEVTRAAAEQASAGQELSAQTLEMGKLGAAASEKAEDQAQTGRNLSEAVLRLSGTAGDIHAANQVLTRGAQAISEEVAQVREDARAVIRIADSLSRTVDQLSRQANALETEVFRFRLPAPKTGGTLRVASHQAEMFEATRGLDPLFTLDNQMVEIAANLYNGLVRSEDGVLLPDLAERWEADPTARRYRFFLRKDVRFHSGAPLAAQDVKQSFERLLDPAQRSPDQWILREVEGAEEFIQSQATQVPGIEVLDKHVLEIRLTEPKAFFLQLLALPAAAIAGRGASGHPVGTGPFRPLDMSRGHVLLERNPFYFRTGLPLLDRLEFLLVKNRDEALEKVRAGTADLVSGLYAEHVRAAPLDAHLVVSGSTPSCWFLGFCATHPPLGDVRVRQGIRAGLDVRSTVERFHPGARIARTLTPPELLGQRGELTAPPPDVARSRQLFAEAGVGKLLLTLSFPPGRSTAQEDPVLFGPLVDAGLLELRHVELGASEFWQRVREGKVSCFRSGWIADYPDPDNFLYFLLHSAAQTVYGLGYRSEEVDHLTTEARISIDPEVRTQLYRKVEKLVERDCPLVPLFHERIHAASTPNLQGLRLHQAPPQVRFEQLWLDREALTSGAGAG